VGDKVVSTGKVVPAPKLIPMIEEKLEQGG